jgi:hypothetical protein
MIKKIFIKVLLLIVGGYFLTAVGVGLFFWKEDSLSGAIAVVDDWFFTGAALRAFSPVESDEEMIALFEQYFTEFERVVKDNRDSCPENLNAHAGVVFSGKMNFVSVSQYGPTLWLPDPFSDQTLNEVVRLQRHLYSLSNDSGTGANKEKSAFAQERKALECKYGAVNFWRSRVKGYAGLRKGYIYFPQSPLIKDATLYAPGTRFPNRPKALGVVVDELLMSTNVNCSYRAVRGNWFIYACH